MKSTSNELVHPNGERLLIRQSAESTNGELLELEATYQPNSTKPPLHYHPHQEEQFEVLSGQFRVRIGEDEQTYSVGDRYTVPANTPHWMYNESDENGRLRWQIRPALQTQQFLETMWGLAADGKVGSSGTPNLLHLAVILREHQNEFRASSPPYWVQRLLFGLLAPIGKMRGYSATYNR